MIFNIPTNEKFTKDLGLVTSLVDIIRFRKGYIFAVSRMSEHRKMILLAG